MTKFSTGFVQPIAQNERRRFLEKLRKHIGVIGDFDSPPPNILKFFSAWRKTETKVAASQEISSPDLENATPLNSLAVKMRLADCFFIRCQRGRKRDGFRVTHYTK
jgi:hypothetical protein